MELSLYLFIFMRLVLLLSMFHPLLTYSSSSMHPLCHENESSALLQFKEGFLIDKSASYDPSAYPKVASWKLEGGGSDCCSWDGVECDEDTGRVVGLDLSSSCLYGSLNSSNTLFSLVRLQKLSLADNHFNYSQIPSGVGHLKELRHLNLSLSRFSGQVPSEISQLTRLSSLDLSRSNLLKLEQPNLLSLVQNLTRLEKLNLNSVYISSPVPVILANSSSLTSLLLQECGLHGNFPAEIFQLPKLESLNVRYNSDLTGHLPEFHWSSPLKSLRLTLTNFSGELPASIGNLNFLNELMIGNCNFSGHVPSSIGNLTELLYLDLNSNKFRGQMPLSTVGNLTKLTHLYLDEININGEIPSFLSNLYQLTHITLHSTLLTGPIPSSLMNLTNLQTLYLDSNQITGRIPSWHMNLTHLQFLNLGFNQITGQIPSWLMNLTHLQMLYLDSNQITGQIQSSKINLPQLKWLSLSNNKLQGVIPRALFELQSLETLDLGANNLSGTMELDVFLKLKNLYALVLSRNNLTLLTKRSSSPTRKLYTLGLASCNLQEFPNFLHNQDELFLLDLSCNEIRGKIPTWTWNVSRSLYFLNLSHNFLTGFDQHPLVLRWTRITIVDISFNTLQGSLPLPSPSIEYYIVSNNKLSGELSPLICNSSLHILDLSDNNLTGVLPQCLGRLGDSLSILNLRSNNFHGTIPQSWTSRCKLKMISLRQNQLQGKVPRSLANCTMLEFLDIGKNHVSDVFPSWLGALPELTVLIVQSNEFHGVIRKPETGFVFPKLRIVDLSNNSFSGCLPPKYFQYWNAMKEVDLHQLTYMEPVAIPAVYVGASQYDYYFSLTIYNKGMKMNYTKILHMLIAIDLSSNKFEGEIPEFIASLTEIRFLNLSNNILTGHIPSSLVNLRDLESLDLSQNKLSGEIPHQLIQLNFLAFFNVSHNHLMGPIPRGNQFSTFENISYEGNPELCGDPLSRKCGQSEASPPLSSSYQNLRSTIEFDWKIVLMGYGSGLVVGVVIGDMLYMRIYEWVGNTFGRMHQKWRKMNRRGARN